MYLGLLASLGVAGVFHNEGSMATDLGAGLLKLLRLRVTEDRRIGLRWANWSLGEPGIWR
jgi:hypothetical protein